MKISTTALRMPDGNDYEFYGKTYYGECNSYASDAFKRVFIDGITSESLVNGLHITVRFNEPCGVSQPYLNVSGSGEKRVEFFDTSNNSGVGSNAWSSGQVVDFVYYNNKWLIVRGAPQPWYGTCVTAGDVATKVVTIYGFNAGCCKPGTIIVVYFTYDNTASRPKLNVSGTGALDIVKTYGASPSYVSSFTKGPKAFVYENGYWVLISAPLEIGTSATQAAAGNHSHGNITRNGSITNVGSSVGNGDDFIVCNSTGLIKKANITFGTSATQYLANNGTWQNVPTAVSDLTNDSGFLTLADLPVYNGGVS